MKKILCKIVCISAFILIVVVGFYFANPKKLVAFRIGVEKEFVDHDLNMALMVLKDKFEKAGYKVGKFAYNGNLYPEELDDAKINVFVRGFVPFYDKRFADDAVNVFYIHRVDQLIRQEFDRYDYYLTSQENLIDKFKDKEVIDYFAADNIKRKAIMPDEYSCDVLYVYEYINPNYNSFLHANYRNKVMSGSAFLNISDEKRKELLESCKVVVYDKGVYGIDDKDYVPYALYDIMSYGRPVITDYNKKLEELYNGLFMYVDELGLINATIRALETPDVVREKKALEHKKILDEQKIDINFIAKYAKKNKNITGYLDNIN